MLRTPASTRRSSLPCVGALAALCCAVTGAGEARAGGGVQGLPDHPRVMLQQSEVDYLKAHLGDPLFAEAWTETKKAADKPKGPDVQKDYVFTDARELYAGALTVDSFDLLYFGMAYALTGDPKYADQAAKWMAGIVQHIDVTYKSGLFWYDTIVWDLMGMRMVMGLDYVWNTFDASEKASFGAWMKTLSDSVRVLHEKDTNGRYYKDNLASGNIKSWDDALIGCIGYLLGDRESIEYVIDSPNNDVVREGVRIEMNYFAKIRHDIVEVWTGDNSEYGPFRTVDWERAIQDGMDYPESIGYQQYHQRANEYVAKASLRHGLDLYHFAARRYGTDQRHHAVQAISRGTLFTTRNVPAEDNSWRTWDGKKWYYSGDDIEGTGRSSTSMAGFANEVAAPELDLCRTEILDVIQNGLNRGSRTYADYHTMGYTWPFQMVNFSLGLEPVGNVTGTLHFAKQPSGDSMLTLFRANHRLRSLVGTPVEVEPDGTFDVLDLAADSYWAVARSPGLKSTLGAVDVVAGQDRTLDVTMREGEHEVLPRSAVYLKKADLPALTLRTSDPGGLASTGGRIYLYAQAADGSTHELIRKKPGLLQLEHVDQKSLELSVDVPATLAFLGNPSELRVWWVMVEMATGVIDVADGDYLLVD